MSKLAKKAQSRAAAPTPPKSELVSSGSTGHVRGQAADVRLQTMNAYAAKGPTHTG